MQNRNKESICPKRINTFNYLRNEKDGKLRETAGVYAFMSFVFVTAVGGVGFEDVAVAEFQFFQDAAFVDYAGGAVVGECAEKDRVLAVLGIEGAELGEVFAEQCVGMCFG